MTLSRDFTSWAWSLELDAVPTSATVSACRHLLDGLGTAIAAHRLGSARHATTVASALGGPREATLLSGGSLVAAPAAALGNGALVHALDYDDTHADALVHPTALVLPTVFAVGEEVGATGREVLTTAIAVYEMVLRLGKAVRHGFHRRGFHATSVCGVFGSALAAARLMGLDEDGAVGALGIAGSMAAGSLEFLHTGSSTKQLHPGLAAQSGILAARLAAAGADGPATILEGANGFYRAYTDQEVEPDDVLESLGADWEVTRITIKPYAACQLSHATLDAVQKLIDELPEPDMVTEITVDVPEDSVPIVCEPRADKLTPRTPYEAKFSLPWSVAAMIADGRLTVSSFEESQLRRDDIRDLARLVTHRPVDPGRAAANAPGRVEVNLRDGSTMTAQVPVSRGGPDRPLSEQELLAKFHENRGGDDNAGRQLAKQMLMLEELDDIRHLTTAATT